MSETEHIIVENRLTGIANHAGYLCHAYSISRIMSIFAISCQEKIK